MRLHERFRVLLVLGSFGLLSGCGNDDDAEAPISEVPTAYTFERNGLSTVDYSGQTDRLNMVAEIKAYITKGDKGEAVEASVLNDMFANTNSPFLSAELNASSKKLEDKTFVSEVQNIKELFEATEVASADVAANGTVAGEGVAGRLQRGTTDSYILVNELGWEFTQFVEKGLMGSTFYNQIFNAYLTDAKVGDGVDNEALVDGKNYTAMEHHWDEAFGYFGVPVDFPTGEPVLEASERRFWGHYTNNMDALLGTNALLMNAYLKGRTAIVNKDYVTRDQQREIIYAGHELVTAAVTVHYINQAIGNFNDGDIGNAFHHLSEAYQFVKAIQYSPKKKLTQAQINDILTSNLGEGGDFWKATVAGLNEARNTLVTTYQELEPVKDQL
ncbi:MULTISPECIES: DUF4856 domain-containing protein [unclassified Imperialibacter]|uniref:DUF4856 domain-containing protein n=1 Tax=unclassified Imperialibacter TaxID=2629706 RepID=UPI001253C982|nr:MULTISPECIES: DUF4856 domain-containing protein [unclassified Imperialibacter]CAD5270585.1 conserved hypothetical protein [Imperialibacter sp. 89]CAD5298316.1 conserved hypothetical protein [Imperialibacter sp. 75]VVT34863.1 conserved hypothetical protein [Imperialibacter sp. EC-SDR9]